MGVSMGRLARDFHVSIQNIKAIVSGKTWKHLLPDLDEGKK
jgi:hypothetical protein